MKKITLVSLFSFIFLLICSLVARFTKPLFITYLVPLIIGVCVLTASGIIALSVKNNTYVNILCFSLSAVAMGFLIRSWYLLRGLENSIDTMLLISLACVIYLWVIFAFIRIPIIRKRPKISSAIAAIYVLLSIIIYIILLVNTKTAFLSTLGYYIFIELSFMFAMSLEAENKKELVRNLTLSSYSVFVVAIIVALFALMVASGDGDCDCDCGGELCDCGIDSKNTNKRSNKRNKAT